MAIHQKLSMLALLIALPMTVQAAGNQLSIGAMGIHSTSMYKDTSQSGRSLPLVSYTTDHFYIRGTEAGYNLLPQRSNKNIGVALAYNFAPFDPSDSSNADILKMNSRDDAIMAVVNGHFGPVFIKLGQDISGAHDGYYAETGLRMPFQVQALRIVPSISYRHMDKKMSNYEFGVSDADSARTGYAIAAYDAPATNVTKISLNSSLPITKSLRVSLGVSYLKYNKSVLDSPLVDKDHKTIVIGGITYSF